MKTSENENKRVISFICFARFAHAAFDLLSLFGPLYSERERYTKRTNLKLCSVWKRLIIPMITILFGLIRWHGDDLGSQTSSRQFALQIKKSNDQWQSSFRDRLIHSNV